MVCVGCDCIIKAYLACQMLEICAMCCWKHFTKSDSSQIISSVSCCSAPMFCCLKGVQARGHREICSPIPRCKYVAHRFSGQPFSLTWCLPSRERIRVEGDWQTLPDYRLFDKVSETFGVPDVFKPASTLEITRHDQNSSLNVREVSQAEF